MGNAELLKRIRTRFDYMVTSWREIREEAKMDMRYVSGDPWDPKEKRAREANGRPVLSLDEITQYINQVVNDVRQNKRAVKVNPEGNGATDETARLRGDAIRQIEYKSKAQAAYSYAFEGAVERSYGYAKISKCYCGPETFDQELRIKRIPNPDSVYLDPDAKEPDFSDMEDGFILDLIRKDAFTSKYPKAKITDFSPEVVMTAPNWIQEDTIQIAEYWYVEKTKRTLLLLDDGSPAGLPIYKEDLPDDAEVTKNAVVMGGKTYSILKQRKTEKKTVYQCITNGVEILEENEWDGKYIPIGVCLGKEMYVDDGSGTKRRIISLVRMARDPQMLYNYYRTCEMEIVGQVPKVPWVGYEGQFEGHEDEWAKANKVPVAYLQAKAKTDATGEQVLPLPTRNVWEPPIQAIEMGAEAARRAIQAAMGISPLPTAAQRQNEKSGVALERISTTQSQGSFHFVDNYDIFIAHMGVMLDDLLAPTYDTARDIGTRGLDEEYSIKRINEPHVDPKSGQQVHYPMDVGEHGVTISTGPSYQSQREEATEFASQIASPELFAAALSGNTKAAQILALAVKLKNGGPVMDKIADILDPQDQNQGPEQLQQAMQQLQQAQLIIQELKQKADDNLKDIEVHRMDNETRERISQADNIVKVEIARIQTHAKIIDSQNTQHAEHQRTQFKEDHAMHAKAADLALAEQAQTQDLAKTQASLGHDAEQQERNRLAAEQQALQSKQE